MLGKVIKPLLVFYTILACAGCASSSEPKTCDPPCQEGEECVEGICTPPPCCPGAPPGENQFSIHGIVLELTTQQPVRAAICIVSPMDALTNPDPEEIQCWESDENGNFFIHCQAYFNEVALGAVTLVEDPEMDGTRGRFFPTGSGAKGWDTSNENVCVYDAKYYAVPNDTVATLDAETSVDSATYGFVIGLVVDAAQNPVEGAVIRKGDGTDLVEVIYPDTAFTTFDVTATSESGIFVLPHTNFATGITEIVAEKEGMTFGAEQAAPKAGFCYFVYILAN